MALKATGGRDGADLGADPDGADPERLPDPSS